MLNEFVCTDGKTIILPVPLNTTIYRVSIRCGDLCMMQDKLFHNVFGKVHECDEFPCHTYHGEVIPMQLKFDNMAYILKYWNTRIFATKEEAGFQLSKIIIKNRERMNDLGFSMRADGYSTCNIKEE